MNQAEKIQHAQDLIEETKTKKIKAETEKEQALKELSEVHDLENEKEAEKKVKELTKKISSYEEEQEELIEDLDKELEGMSE